MVHYFEKEAVRSYTDYLHEIEIGNLENVACPKLARDYYGLDRKAKLSDMIRCVRDDERKHAAKNRTFSNKV